MQREIYSFLLLIVINFISVPLIKDVEGTAVKRPNIVFIVADDLGWNDIGFHNPEIISPNIDRLAAEGVLLNQAYVQPVCSPSRSAFMTGYYPFRMGLQHMVIVKEQNVCVPLNKTFLSQVLKSHGYVTHAVGKWHLGFCNWRCTPTFRGFDSFYGYYNSREDYYDKTCGGWFDFHNNEQVHWKANGTYSAYQYAAHVEQLISKHDPSVPLFLYLPFQSVHEPIQVPERYYKMYPSIKNKGRRTYSGMVTALDDAVGHVVTSLKTKGIYDDTLIFFTADNGGYVNHHGNNYPLRGAKISIWEGGTRVPAFVHGKALNRTGVKHDGLMHAVDWFPTIVEASGIEYHDSDWDGMSQWKSISMSSESPRTEFIYNLDDSKRPTQGHAAIRVGDYKLIEGYPGMFNDWYKPQTVNAPSSTPLDDKDLEILYDHVVGNWTNFKGLYDLKNDPYEHVNLYEKKPDIVKKLHARMEYHKKKMVPANYPPHDPKSNPAYFGGAWSPGWC